MIKRGGLGRGLSSLIPQKISSIGEDDVPRTSPSLARGSDFVLSKLGREQISYISPDNISANPYQPRTKFEEDKLKELTESIKLHGIIQPLVVNIKSNGQYELIAGERRLRAALNLGLKVVPVIVRPADELKKFILSLVENLQREDLDFIELAKAYQRLLKEFDFTQEELAKQVGQSRPQVANIIRLLALPLVIQESLAVGEISFGHAKVLLSLPNQEQQFRLWKKITLNKLTVRSTEEEARATKVDSHIRRIPVRDANLISLQEELEKRLGTRVTIKGALNKGQIIIDYYSRDDLQKTVGVLTKG